MWTLVLSSGSDFVQILRDDDIHVDDRKKDG